MRKPCVPTIVALGYCSVDYVCVVPQVPIDEKVEILERRRLGGGPAATAAVAAARLGAKTAFCGAVGDDDLGAAIVAELRREGVDVQGVVTRPGAESPVAFCWAEQGTGRRSIAWSRGSAKPLTPEELDRTCLAKAALLHLDGHQTQAAFAAAAIVKAAGGLVSLDAGTLRPDMVELAKQCDIVIASERYAARFLGAEDPERAVRAIQAQGPRLAAVTLGKRGWVGFDGQHLLRGEAFAVPVVDTTGAGDVFHGAFCVAWLETGDLRHSLTFAAAAAALKCRQLGGRAGIPTRPELDEFLRRRGGEPGRSE